MNVENIVIPGGILSTWSGLQPLRSEDDGQAEPEDFDIAEVARQRARSLSTSLNQQDGDRGDQLERLAGVIQSNENTQIPLQQIPEEDQTLVPQALLTQRPARSNTIELGDLGRSRATGLSTPANPGLQLDRKPSTSFITGQKQTENNTTGATTGELENSYVFQSLHSYQMGPRPHGSQSSTGPSVFLARNGLTRTTGPRRGSSRRTLDRNQSNQSETSQYSNVSVLRRASVIAENAVEKVKETFTSAVRRSSLQEVYEKAKIRQVQLQRSTAFQIGFEYTFYLLMAAIVYFVFIGYPLWNGLVLTIYYIFDMKLVVPAGTAIFLGIGFL